MAATQTPGQTAVSRYDDEISYLNCRDGDLDRLVSLLDARNYNARLYGEPERTMPAITLARYEARQAARTTAFWIRHAAGDFKD